MGRYDKRKAMADNARKSARESRRIRRTAAAGGSNPRPSWAQQVPSKARIIKGLLVSAAPRLASATPAQTAATVNKLIDNMHMKHDCLPCLVLFHHFFSPCLCNTGPTTQSHITNDSTALACPSHSDIYPHSRLLLFRLFLSSCEVMGYLQCAAQPTMCCSKGVRPWQ